MEFLFGKEPLQFGGGPGGENAKNGKLLRLFRHRFGIKNTQMPDNLALAI